MKNACLNSAFSGVIQAVTSSTSAITWTLHSGSLPTGLSMAASGKVLTISGTPTATGAFTFVIRATLPDGTYAAKQYTIGIAKVANSALADGNVGVAYSQTLTVDGPVTGTETWQVTSGALPAGLSLNAATGEISGTPTTEEFSTFIVCFTNDL